MQQNGPIMLMTIGQILDQAALAELAQTLPCMHYENGRATAGWHAVKVKNNEQARASTTLDLLQGQIKKALLANPVFTAAVRPKALTSLLISKTSVGGQYGSHVDSPIMGGLRTDVSFTLFLNNPDDYDGGELIIESAAGDDGYKLPAGSVVVYPSTTLHRVAEVTRGERYVAAGWAQSYIRDASKRELLFDLDTAQRRLFDQHGKTAEFDLLAKCSANLTRRWAEM
jgi:PKHD-type hydroxylase